MRFGSSLLLNAWGMVNLEEVWFFALPICWHLAAHLYPL